MRFHVTFRRQKGSASSDPALGSDAAPTTTPPGSTAGSQAKDNILSCRVRDIAGWPVQRICVGWTTTASSPVALNGSLYSWDKSLQHWFLINASPVSMAPNQLVFFDVPGFIEPPATRANVQGLNSTGQSTAASDSNDLMLVVTDPGSAVNGVYQIGMGPDLTTIGT